MQLPAAFIDALRDVRFCWPLVGCLLVAGCASQKPPPPPSAKEIAAKELEDATTDPCAIRLHDVCGPLLLYYATHRELPPNIDALKKMPGFENVKELVCPVSNQPYIYNISGLPSPDRGGRLILYDATPVHGGKRWAISIAPPANNGPLVTKVVLLPETFFPANPSK